MYDDFVNYMREFLELCKEELDLEKLPKIVWMINGDTQGTQPTFGMFVNKDKTIRVEIKNRHPLDVMRTLAHELVHFKQHLKGQINNKSGDIGSKQENEANAVAGIIMRQFNRTHPDAFKLKAIT